MTVQRIGGAAIVAFVLITASDFPTTAPLAVAFAYLLLISSALVVGPAAFDNLNQMIGVKATAGGGGKKR